MNVIFSWKECVYSVLAGFSKAHADYLVTSDIDNDMPESRIDSRPAPATSAARPTIVSVMN